MLLLLNLDESVNDVVQSLFNALQCVLHDNCQYLINLQNICLNIDTEVEQLWFEVNFLADITYF